MTATRSNRIAQVLLIVMGFFVGCLITFIVGNGTLKNSLRERTYESRKMDAEEKVQRLNIPGIGALEYQRLFEAMSEPGESLDGFALRIAPQLRAFSDSTGFEACGVLATDGERFGVVVGTNRAHVACVNFSRIVPESMKSTGQTIHSHGKAGRGRANANDLRLMGRGDLRLDRTGMMSGQSLTTFSEMDFKGGPGYLAVPGGVKHQNGASAVRRVVGTDTSSEGVNDRLASL